VAQIWGPYPLQEVDANRGPKLVLQLGEGKNVVGNVGVGWASRPWLLFGTGESCINYI
jgi:hypothetical protein